MSWKGKQAYREFLGTDFWKELSAAAIARDGKCVRCGDEKRLQAHHKFYRKDWFKTELGDLEVLCRACHRKAHGREYSPFQLLWFKLRNRMSYAEFSGDPKAKLTTQEWRDLWRLAEEPWDIEEMAGMMSEYIMIHLNPSPPGVRNERWDRIRLNVHHYIFRKAKRMEEALDREMLIWAMDHPQDSFAQSVLRDAAKPHSPLWDAAAKIMAERRPTPEQAVAQIAEHAQRHAGFLIP